MTRDMAEREPFYARARLIVACDGLSDDEIAVRILAAWDRMERGGE